MKTVMLPKWVLLLMNPCGKMTCWTYFLLACTTSPRPTLAPRNSPLSRLLAPGGSLYHRLLGQTIHPLDPGLAMPRMQQLERPRSITRLVLLAGCRHLEVEQLLLAAGCPAPGCRRVTGILSKVHPLTGILASSLTQLVWLGNNFHLPQPRLACAWSLPPSEARPPLRAGALPVLAPAMPEPVRSVIVAAPLSRMENL